MKNFRRTKGYFYIAIMIIITVSMIIGFLFLKKNNYSKLSKIEEINSNDEKKAETLSYGNLLYEIVDVNSVAIVGYTGENTSVVIPETIEGFTVTSIGNSAFMGENIQSIVIPNTVTKIEEAAFAYCENLKYVDLSNALKEIRRICFWRIGIRKY